MVYRISPDNVRPPRGGPSGALAMVLVIALTLAIWLAAGRDPGSSTFGGQDPDRAASSAAEAVPTDPASGLPLLARSELPVAVDALLDDLDEGVAQASGVTRRPFLNGAGLLPVERTTGYYDEYAVGAGSLVVAGAGGERYYSDDAGASYVRVGP